MSSRVRRHFSREWQHRRLMFRSMTTSLILHGQIETTLPKAKELRKFADRMIGYCKKGTPVARRQAGSFLTSKAALSHLFLEYPKRFQFRNGGYTRIRASGFRKGDCAEMAIIELIRDDLTMTPVDYFVQPEITKE